MTTASTLVDEIAARLATDQRVVGIALGGSQAGTVADERSDLDLYVFGDEPPSLALRRTLGEEHDAAPEIGNTAFGPGDEWAAKSGIGVDLIYWSPGWIEDELARLLDRHQASVGYTTALWFTIREMRSLFDRTGWLAELKEQAARPYPEPLREAIVRLNQPLLRDARGSFLHQIELAIARDDPISVQHRTAALLASYADVLFALNRQPHPGEKRILLHLAARCTLLPNGFDAHVRAVIAASCAPRERNLMGQLNTLVDGVDALLVAEGLLPARG
jgi:hypothetical protein